jgi:NAD(P)-dependent dehydrogenase (short-subunit alcohol dehydrogenase family)
MRSPCAVHIPSVLCALVRIARVSLLLCYSTTRCSAPAPSLLLTRICRLSPSGLGSAIAGRFAAAGYSVALCSRSLAKLEPLAAAIRERGHIAQAFPFDASSEADVKAGFAAIKAKFGDDIGVLVYNPAPGVFGQVKVADVKTEDFEAQWRIGCLGLLLCSKEVLPSMQAAKKGTILVTGATASLRAMEGRAAFASTKFAVRALTQSMSRELHPQGIHVVHIVVDGIVDAPRTRAWFEAPRAAKIAAGETVAPWEEVLMQPADVAEQYMQLHLQPRSSWSHEFEIRSMMEGIYSR